MRAISAFGFASGVPGDLAALLAVGAPKGRISRSAARLGHSKNPWTIGSGTGLKAIRPGRADRLEVRSSVLWPLKGRPPNDQRH